MCRVSAFHYGTSLSLFVTDLIKSVSVLCRMVFLPLWAFHAVVARGRFSLPAPVAPRNRHVCSFLFLFICLPLLASDMFMITFLFLQWAPCHAVVATPLLVAFELLLCIYLESSYGK